MEQQPPTPAKQLRGQIQQTLQTIDQRLAAIEARRAELTPRQVMKLAMAQRSLAEMGEQFRITFNALSELESELGYPCPPRCLRTAGREFF